MKNARKIKNASPTRENVSILHYALGKNASKFFSRFSRVLLAFLFTNANQKHSVIGALDTILSKRMLPRRTDDFKFVSLISSETSLFFLFYYF